MLVNPESWIRNHESCCSVRVCVSDRVCCCVRVCVSDRVCCCVSEDRSRDRGLSALQDQGLGFVLGFVVVLVWDSVRTPRVGVGFLWIGAGCSIPLHKKIDD